MQVPLDIAFEHMEPSEFVEERIREHVAKLERYCDRMTSCRVVLDQPDHNKHKGNHFAVRIHIQVPNQPDVVVTRHPPERGEHEDAYVALRDAFEAARKQLEHHKSRH